MRVLVIGGDGLIGSALADTLRARGHSVVTTTRRRAGADSVKKVFFDLASEEPAILPNAEVSIICAAIAKFEDCRRDPELARRVDVTAPVALAKSCIARGGKAMLLSSSAVFDCLSPRRKADETRAPRSVYGTLKAEAETRFLDCGAGASVLRMTKVVHPGQGILARWIDDLAAGNEIEAFTDHRFCPIPLDAVIEAIAAIMDDGGDGIFQVSGADDISYADAARHIAWRLGVPTSRVRGVQASTHHLLGSEVTPFTSLDVSRLEAGNEFVAPSPLDVIDQVFGPSFATARLSGEHGRC
jgi:dTDP-4-dehydrorhamnose reductase